jgi:uncharacterized membrane-anchored protein
MQHTHNRYFSLSSLSHGVFLAFGNQIAIKLPMRSYKLLFLLIASLASSSLPILAAKSERPIALEGPAKAPLGTVAQIDLPVGYTFLDGKTTRELMEAHGSPTSDNVLGLLSPTNADWSVIFTFNDDGYVKDDDKDKLDADKLLESYKKGTAQANKRRVKAGNPPLEIVGWDVPPRYDETTHNLEWAIRATSGGDEILNYNTHLLGRKGVVEVVLIIDPDQLKEMLPEYRKLLAGYSFQSGQTYAEYRSGDKVAKYGLAGLVVAGAGVAAVKLGLLAWLALMFKKGAKLIILALVAIGVVIKKIFNKITGNRGSAMD